MMTHGRRVALGFRVHSGWAALVAVAVERAEPSVIGRERVEMVSPNDQEARQPYHAVEGCDVAEAERLLSGWKREATTLARSAVAQAIASLRSKGHEVVGSAILMGSGRLPRNLAAILSSHAAIHTADGEHFRDAVRAASESAGVPVSGVKEREIMERATDRLGISAAQLPARLTSLGRPLGPPWGQDQKLAALGAWMVLAGDLPQPGR